MPLEGIIYPKKYSRGEARKDGTNERGKRGGDMNDEDDGVA